jgi:hypothetical protein
VDGAGPYSAATWTDVLPTQRGRRDTIGASTTRFVISGAVDFLGPNAQWPTDLQLAGWTINNNPLGSWDQTLVSSAKVKVSMPGSDVPLLSYTGPWMNFAYQIGTSRSLRVISGTMKIHKMFLSSGTPPE